MGKSRRFSEGARMTRRSDAYREQSAGRLVGQVSAMNRPVVQKDMTAKRAQRLKPASLMNVALPMLGSRGA